MKNFLGIISLLIIFLPATIYSQGETLRDLCKQFNEVNTLVRDGEITKSNAEKIIGDLLLKIRTQFFLDGGIEYDTEQWVFPLRGYGASAIGGTNGSGYISKGYSYFDGNKHGGHPAHDIFIRDKNQDCLDDFTGEPVDVLSVSGGVVVALEKSWETNSNLRGGIYVWIYDTKTDALFYYAHNRKLTVELGDIVKPGDKIAEVGRTGLNAFKKRSPTHLHLTYLKVNGGNLTPENPYEYLLKIKTLN